MGDDNRNWRGQWSRRAEWIDPNPTQTRMGTAWLYLTVVDMQTAGTENNSRAVYVKEWIQKETKHQCRNLNRNGIYCRLIPPNATWHESYSYMKLFHFKKPIAGMHFIARHSSLSVCQTWFGAGIHYTTVVFIPPERNQVFQNLQMSCSPGTHMTDR